MPMVKAEQKSSKPSKHFLLQKPPSITNLESSIPTAFAFSITFSKLVLSVRLPL